MRLPLLARGGWVGGAPSPARRAGSYYDLVSKVDSHLTGLLRKYPFQIGTTFGSRPPPEARGQGSGAAGPWTRRGRAMDAPWTLDLLTQDTARGDGEGDAEARLAPRPVPGNSGPLTQLPTLNSRRSPSSIVMLPLLNDLSINAPKRSFSDAPKPKKAKEASFLGIATVDVLGALKGQILRGIGPEDERIGIGVPNLAITNGSKAS